MRKLESKYFALKRQMSKVSRDRKDWAEMAIERGRFMIFLKKKLRKAGLGYVYKIAEKEFLK